MTSVERTRVLQALRLKGRVMPDALAAAAGLDEATCQAQVRQLVAAGYAEDARGRLRLTAPGRDQLAEVLTREREAVDHSALRRLYDEFDTQNSALKTLMTRWQLREDGSPNDHSDATYDGTIVAELVVLDERFRPLLARLVDVAQRLSHYPPRFAAAVQQLQAGDHSWFARPLVDSYHTVWFELHEDLIGLAGLSRAQEAAAGRAE